MSDKAKEALEHARFWIKSRAYRLKVKYDVTEYNGNKLFILPTFVFSWDERSVSGHKFAFIIAFGKKYYRLSFGPVIEELKFDYE